MRSLVNPLRLVPELMQVHTTYIVRMQQVYAVAIIRFLHKLVISASSGGHYAFGLGQEVLT